MRHTLIVTSHTLIVTTGLDPVVHAAVPTILESIW